MNRQSDDHMLALALLEVMDKEPSLPGMWVVGLGLGGIGFWSARRWIWPAVFFLAWEFLWLWGTHEELTDRFLGPDILAEAGRGYVVQSYITATLPIVATAAGLAWGILRWWRYRRRRLPMPPAEMPTITV